MSKKTRHLFLIYLFIKLMQPKVMKLFTLREFPKYIIFAPLIIYLLKPNILYSSYFSIEIRLIIFNKLDLNLNLFYINQFVQCLLNFLYTVISLYVY